MMELRWIKRSDDKILQVRFIALQIGESSCGDLVIEPQPPVSLNMEDNWSEWEDVSLVEELK